VVSGGGGFAGGRTGQRRPYADTVYHASRHCGYVFSMLEMEGVEDKESLEGVAWMTSSGGGHAPGTLGLPSQPEAQNRNERDRVSLP
jgi:hypothetical protein